MRKEIPALEDNVTWIVVDLLGRTTAIRRKWVYKLKYYSNDIVEHYKTRLVILAIIKLKESIIMITLLPPSRWL